MLSKLRVILSIGLGLAVWNAGLEAAHAQIGLRIQIGGSPFGVGPSYGVGPYGPGVYTGGFNVPFGVGPSIAPSSRAYMGPQYQSGYRGYYGGYGVGPSPLDTLLYETRLNEYRSYGYSNQSSIDQLRAQQYALQRQQLELQAAQRSLSTQQRYPYSTQSRYTPQAPRGSSSSSDLRPGMVLPDGSTVISVGPISPSGSASPSSVQPASPNEPTVAPAPPANILPSSETKKAVF